MDPILGEIRIFAGTKAPAGWHFCDGSTLSLSDYNALYSLLGTIYGGDGVATFGIPDLRGRAVLNQGKSLANTTYPIGQKAGAETVALGTANIVPHTHSFTVSAQAATSPVPTNCFLAAPVDPTPSNKAIELYLPSTATGLTTSQLDAASVSDSAEGGQDHENRQPFMALNYIIALVGDYPQFP